MLCHFSGVQHSDPVIHIYPFFSSYLPPSSSIPRDWTQFPVPYTAGPQLLIHSKCNSLRLLTPNSQSIPFPSPLGNHTSFLHVCRSVSVL